MSFLDRFNQSLPRYTSYPTAPNWEALDEGVYIQSLAEIPLSTPLSLYFHIPFCKTMCLFCGCSVILNRNPEREERYVDWLCREIDLVCNRVGYKRPVLQLHLGGGTPTKLSEKQLERLYSKITSSFSLIGEIAIEIDPRTVHEDRGAKLRFLKGLGFNRVSFGVQDTNERVQEAVKRRQTKEMTEETYHLAKALGFEEINLDLLYGLPFQTQETFEETSAAILALRPDRIALFSYAEIPWLKPHQKAIRPETLPKTEEKFAIYASARKRFTSKGYVAIGMDHFALTSSTLAQSYRNKTLHRNFQGYTVLPTPVLLGFGVTAIGSFGGAYFQNSKELPEYGEKIERGQLPLFRGKVLSEEDALRRWVIEKLMCTFEVDKRAFFHTFGKAFDSHFASNGWKEVEELVVNTEERFIVKPEGELFIRNIAACFDLYLKERQHRFSKAI